MIAKTMFTFSLILQDYHKKCDMGPKIVSNDSQNNVYFFPDFARLP